MDIDWTRYRGLVERATEAFANDPHYAIAIAEAANFLKDTGATKRAGASPERLRALPIILTPKRIRSRSLPRTEADERRLRLAREWKAKNRERTREHSRMYRERYPEHYLEYQRNWREANT